MAVDHEHGSTEVVVVVIVFAQGEHYPLIPSEDYTLCDCDESVLAFAKKAIDAHPTVREWDWDSVIVIFSDKKGKRIERRRTRPRATA